MTEEIYFEVDTRDHIATVTMRRGKVNAQNDAFRQQCIETFDRLSDLPDVRVIILTGAGNVFSAGADLGERPDPVEAGAFRRHNRYMRDAADAIFTCSKPTIAAINGAAVGAGAALASVCDIMVSSDDAYLWMPEVGVGMAGGVRHLLRHFGQSNARYAMFTARRIFGPELLRMNVVTASVPAEQLLPTCWDIAAAIAVNSPLAIAAVKQSFIVGEDMPLYEGYAYEQTHTQRLSKSGDFREAQHARSEGRKPDFQGR